jgi:hypothetical protein
MLITLDCYQDIKNCFGLPLVMSSAMKFIEGEENVIIFNLSQRSFEAYM